MNTPIYLNDLDPSLLVVQAGRGADVRRAAGELMIADVSVQRQGPPQLSVAGIEATVERSFDLGSPEDVWGSGTRLSVLTWASMQLARTR